MTQFNSNVISIPGESMESESLYDPAFPDESDKVIVKIRKLREETAAGNKSTTTTRNKGRLTAQKRPGKQLWVSLKKIMVGKRRGIIL